MVLHIKNMVCNRCIRVVTDELKQLHFSVKRIELGVVELLRPLTPEEKNLLKERLVEFGFELLDDKKAKMIEQIKTLLIVLVHYNMNEKPLHMRYSDYLEKEIGMEYSSLSKLFSEVEGITIEQYLILQKTERIKELLVYDELNVSEIAYQLGYSSIAHLSTQFKKVTGHTPSEFKGLHFKPRKTLDKV
ncbi:MAG: helix-turn-helix domain-containing protein [Bacteroidota bacterium]